MFTICPDLQTLALVFSGYWQLDLTKRAKKRSAFCTRNGQFQFTCMPFGLSNAPFTFCHLMHIVMSDLLYIQRLQGRHLGGWGFTDSPKIYNFSFFPVNCTFD